MNKEMELIDDYIQEVNIWLPYPMNLKSKILENLKSDILETIKDTGEKNPVLAFGDPYHVAKSISKGQDWGTIRADYGTRFWAYLFDQVIIFLGILIGIYLYISISLRSGFNSLSLFFTAFFVLLPYTLFWIYGYFVILEKIFAATPGKRLLGLSVCDESGVRITWLQAIIRNITKFETTLLLLDTIIAHYQKTNYQRLMDTVAKTIVVRRINF